MPLVDQPSHLAVQPVFRGELCAVAVAEAWEVEGLKAIAIAGVIREFLLREGGAIFVQSSDTHSTPEINIYYIGRVAAIFRNRSF